MKKLTIVAMVVLAAILVASPVLAAGSSHPMQVAKQDPKKKNWGKPTIISMTGTIRELGENPDTGAKKAIQIDIQMTNKAFRIYRKTTKWVDTTPTTKYILWVDGKRSDLDIDYFDLKEGDKISINARVFGEVFKARRVQVRQPRYP